MTDLVELLWLFGLTYLGGLITGAMICYSVYTIIISSDREWNIALAGGGDRRR